MSRFEELARLKEQEGRRQAILAREKETGNSNRALKEKIWIERDLLAAAPWLLQIAEAFQPGTGEVLRTAIILLVASGASEDCIMIDCLRRLQAACEEMER